MLDYRAGSSLDHDGLIHPRASRAIFKTIFVRSGKHLKTLNQVVRSITLYDGYLFLWWDHVLTRDSSQMEKPTNPSGCFTAYWGSTPIGRRYPTSAEEKMVLMTSVSFKLVGLQIVQME